MFEKMSLVPTFFFIDPWGYKGLSLRLVNQSKKTGVLIASSSSTTIAFRWA